MEQTPSTATPQADSTGVMTSQDDAAMDQPAQQRPSLPTLAPELLQLIAEMLDKPSQARFNSVSRMVRDATMSILYREVKLLGNSKAKTFVTAHGITMMPSQNTVLKHTAHLSVSCADPRALYSLLASCGSNLKDLWLSVNGNCMSFGLFVALAHALPSSVDLQKLCLSGIPECTYYFWVKNRKNLRKLCFDPPNRTLPPVPWPEIDPDCLPKELHFIYALEVETSEAGRFFQRLVARSANHLHHAILAGEAVWADLTPGCQLPSLPSLRVATFFEVPCYLLREFLHDHQHVCNLSWTCIHDHPLIPDSHCEEHIFESLPPKLYNLEMWNLSFSPETSPAAIKQCIFKLKYLTKLPTIKYRSDGDEDGSSPCPKQRRWLLKKLSARGLSWEKKEKEDFITWA